MIFDNVFFFDLFKTYCNLFFGMPKIPLKRAFESLTKLAGRGTSAGGALFRLPARLANIFELAAGHLLSNFYNRIAKYFSCLGPKAIEPSEVFGVRLAIVR